MNDMRLTERVVTDTAKMTARACRSITGPTTR